MTGIKDKPIIMFVLLEIDLKKERTALLSSGKEHVVLVSETGTVQEWKGSAKCNKLRWVRFSSTVCYLREIII